MFLHKSFIWEKSCSWDIGQNALRQSNCMIFKRTISPKQINETTSFLACLYKFTKIKSGLKIFWLGMVKNGYGQSGLWALKFTISQEWSDGINWFFACCYRFTKIKSWSKIYWMGMVKNGWVWPVWSWDSKTDCNSKLNKWKKQIFFKLVRIQES